MKKSTFISTIAFAFVMLLTTNVNAQKFPGLDKSPMDAASYPTSYKESNKLIKIVYSRPQLKGRELGKLAPEGKVWRTGANEAAELTLYKDMKFGDKLVKAGTYTFYMIPGEQCTGIISKDLNVWGSYFYKEANDVARISVPSTMSEDSLEAFSIVFDKAESGAINMHLGWGKARATFPFTK